MRKMVNVTGEKMNGLYWFLKRKLGKRVNEKKEGGFETFIVVLLMIAICVGLSLYFKEQITSFIKTLFDDLKGDVLTDFMSKPTAS